MSTRMVVLMCVLAPSCRTFSALVRVCFCMQSASGLDALISRVSHTVEDRSCIVRCVLRMALSMILLRLFRSTLLSALGFAVEELGMPTAPSCLVQLTLRRSCLRCRCSSAPTPSLLVDTGLALVFRSLVLGRANASGGHVRSTFASHQILARKGCGLAAALLR